MVFSLVQYMLQLSYSCPRIVQGASGVCRSILLVMFVSAVPVVCVDGWVVYKLRVCVCVCLGGGGGVSVQTTCVYLCV